MISSLVRSGDRGHCFLARSLSPGAAQTPSVKFTLDFAIQGQQSPFVLAAEGGHFARAGVNVQVDRGYGSADCHHQGRKRRLRHGLRRHRRIDPVQRQADRRQGHQRVPGLRRRADADPVAQEDRISPSRAISQANGWPRRPARRAACMFPLFALANGLDPASVNWIDVTPQLRETLLVQGQTDATTALVTDLAGLERLGITENDLNIMRFSDFGVGLYGHCILTTPEFAAKNPETVKKVVKGIAEALKAAIADPARIDRRDQEARAVDRREGRARPARSRDQERDRHRSGEARGTERRRSRPHEADHRDGGQGIQHAGARRRLDLPAGLSAAGQSCSCSDHVVELEALSSPRKRGSMLERVPMGPRFAGTTGAQ